VNVVTKDKQIDIVLFELDRVSRTLNSPEAREYKSLCERTLAWLQSNTTQPAKDIERAVWSVRSQRLFEI
jgi:hypothetical protein